MTSGDVDPTRAVLAVAAAAVIGVCYVLSALVLPRIAAIGIFSAEDWLAFTPDFFGRLYDYALGIGVTIGFWAIAVALGRRDLFTAMAIGGLAVWLMPQLNAVIYVWRMFGAIDWDIALSSLLRAWPHLLLGAGVAAVMWRIAYRRA